MSKLDYMTLVSFRKRFEVVVTANVTNKGDLCWEIEINRASTPNTNLIRGYNYPIQVTMIKIADHPVGMARESILQGFRDNEEMEIDANDLPEVEELINEAMDESEPLDVYLRAKFGIPEPASS